MDKLLSANTIKNVFYALGAKTSDSNYAVALLNKTSGAPAGFMDMSNLASVLGGLKFSMYPPDVVNLKQGVYLAAGTVDSGSTITAHLPAASWYYLICFERHQGGNIVFAIKTDGSNIHVTAPDKDASTVTWYKYQGTSV